MSIHDTYRTVKRNLNQKLKSRGVETVPTDGLTTLINDIQHIPCETGNEIPFSKTVNVVWNDDGNSRRVRKDKIDFILLFKNKEVGFGTVTASGGWQYTITGLIDVYNNPTDVNNSSNWSIRGEDIESYSWTSNGLTITYTLQTGDINVSLHLIDLPEGIDLSMIRVVIEGPDPHCPFTIPYSYFNQGDFTLENVIYGSYVAYVRGHTIEDMILISNNLCDGGYLSSSSEALELELELEYLALEDASSEYTYDPEHNVSEDLDNLDVHIIGKDINETVSYTEFISGQYITNEKTGYYVVFCNANIIKGYMLSQSSVIAIGLPVYQISSCPLFFQYIPIIPYPEPEPFEIPVSIQWNDNNNVDGNRPSGVVVRLYADGVEVDLHTLAFAENWQYTFTDLPQFNEGGEEIYYSINVDPVEWYMHDINDFNISFDYYPETESKTVQVVWDDRNDSLNTRPSSLIAILNYLAEGRRTDEEIIRQQNCTLNADNGWSYTFTAPTRINNKEIITYGITFDSYPQAYLVDSSNEEEPLAGFAFDSNNLCLITFTDPRATGGLPIKPPKTPPETPPE